MFPFNFEDIDPDLNYFEDENNINCRYFSIKNYADLQKEYTSFIQIFHHNIRSFEANSDLTLGIFECSKNPETLVFFRNLI